MFEYAQPFDLQVTEIALDLPESIWSSNIKLAVITDSSAYLSAETLQRRFVCLGYSCQY